jgi:hypothetical protein
MPRCGRSRPAVCRFPVDACRDPLIWRPSSRPPPPSNWRPTPRTISVRPSARGPSRLHRDAARGVTTACARHPPAEGPGAEAVYGTPRPRPPQDTIGK